MKILFKTFALLGLFFFLNFSSVKQINAKVEVSSSANLKRMAVEEFSDYRVLTLKNYLVKHRSPLSYYSKDIVFYADYYNLDWRLVPAIAGVESTFGKNIPTKSYNAFGWANGAYRFNSWSHSISLVSRTLRENYIDDGLVTTYQISRRYAPPSNSWAWKVDYFMEDIDPIQAEFNL